MCISLCVLTLHLSPVYLIVHVFIRNGHFEGHGFSVSFRVICTPHFCVPTIRNYHEITYLSKVSFLLSCAFLCVSSHCTALVTTSICVYMFSWCSVFSCVFCTAHFCASTIRNYHEITYLSKVLRFSFHVHFLVVSSHCTCHHQHMCLYVFFMVLCFLPCILHCAFLCLYNT